MTDSPIFHAMSKTRIETFSDNIFAILLTLLVFNFKVPQLHGPNIEADLQDQLFSMHAYFTTYAMSFALVCLFWVAHHQLMHTLKHINTGFLWLNNLFLFCLVFICFPTQVLGAYPDTETATMLFGGSMIAASFSFSLLRYHAYFQADLANDALSGADKRHTLMKGLWGTGLYAIAILISAISPDITLSMYALIPFLYFLHMPRLSARNCH